VEIQNEKYPAIAVLGGAYNPPTIAYETIIQLVLEKLPVERLLLMPYRRRAFGKFLAASAEHRHAMALLLAHNTSKQVEVSDLELKRPGKSYTIDTVNELKNLYPGHSIYWVIGTDILYELADWKDIDVLSTQVIFLAVIRPGYPVSRSLVDKYHVQLLAGAKQMPDVSASLIRRRLAQGRNIEGLLPAEIGTYIRKHHLYSGTDSL